GHNHRRAGSSRGNSSVRQALAGGPDRQAVLCLGPRRTAAPARTARRERTDRDGGQDRCRSRRDRTASPVGGSNETAIEAVIRFLERFAVMGRLDPEADARERLETWFDQPGMLGIRMTFFKAHWEKAP